MDEFALIIHKSGLANFRPDYRANDNSQIANRTIHVSGLIQQFLMNIFRQTIVNYVLWRMQFAFTEN